MTGRDDVLAAFVQLGESTGRVDFSPAEIRTHMQQNGSAYARSTVGTLVSSYLTITGDLVRSAPGLYRLARYRASPIEPVPHIPSTPTDRITEDFVKATLKDFLETNGWTVTVAWGRQPGIDIEARRDGERLIIEAKGEPKSLHPQHRYSYLSAIGELVERIDDPSATYGLAFPDKPPVRELVERLPDHARQRLALTIWFVTDAGDVVTG